LADENREIFQEKVKLGKFSAESENFFGNRGGRNLKQEEMHHCLMEGWTPLNTVKFISFNASSSFSREGTDVLTKCICGNFSRIRR